MLAAKQLTVDMDTTDEYKDYFLTTWPKALERLKDIVESNTDVPTEPAGTA